MALNGASHNPMGEPTGNVSGFPPKLDKSTKSELLDSSATQQKGGDESVPPEVKKAERESGGKEQAQVEGGQSLNPS